MVEDPNTSTEVFKKLGFSEEKKIYLALMKQEMLSDIEKQEDINNRGAVSKSDSIIV